jgi:hypothetical protein
MHNASHKNIAAHQCAQGEKIVVNGTQKTFIAMMADCVDSWRKREGMSQATVVDEIVKAHERIAGPQVTGIAFEPNRDEYNRMKANSDRVWRWLDDKSKDRNLLPANFIPSVLAAMPADLRIALLDDMLRPFGLATRSLASAQEKGFDPTLLACKNIKETAESHQAVAALVHDMSMPCVLKADKETAEAIEALTETKRQLEGVIKNRTLQSVRAA